MRIKTPIHIFSTFGLKINEFEQKKLEKTKKMQKPKNLKVHLIYTSFSVFSHEKGK